MNPQNQAIEFSKVFDTNDVRNKFDDFASNDLPDGLIVIAACKDDCRQHLSKEGRAWFEDMGSKEI